MDEPKSPAAALTADELQVLLMLENLIERRQLPSGELTDRFEALGLIARDGEGRPCLTGAGKRTAEAARSGRLA